MSERPSWPTLRRILVDGWRYRWLTLILIVSTSVVAAMSAYQLKLATGIIEQLQYVTKGMKLGGDAGFDLAAMLRMLADCLDSGKDPGLPAVLGELRRTALLLLAGALPMAGIAYGAWITGQYLANRCTRDLRERFVAHLVRLDLAFHGDQNRGELLTRMTADLDRLYSIQSLIFGRILQRPAMALGCAAWLFFMSWQLGVVVFLILAPVGFFIARILRTTRRRSHRAQESLATALTAFEQITTGIRVIKTMGSTEREVTRYAGLNLDLFRSRQRMARARARSEAVTQGSVWAIGGAAFLASVWLFQRQLLSPAELLGSLMAFGLMINALREAQRGWADVVENLPSAERVYQVLDTTATLVDRPRAPAASAPTRQIRFEQVDFRYPASTADILRGIDLTIPVGSVVALVGKTGCGKSTILDLLPRLRDVTGGRVTWDGVDVREVQADSLIHHCAIVSQEPFLFNDTIRNNIRYGKPEATEDELIAAAKRANVHDDIVNLEGREGYETLVGDRGGRLSGGQRQRIAIARALLRDAPILLLDEPTSALDAGSERHVQAALEELMRGRTTVVIAHRLATVQHADAIHVIGQPADGQPSQVLESGTHAELVARGGRYAELVRLQQLV